MYLFFHIYLFISNFIIIIIYYYDFFLLQSRRYKSARVQKQNTHDDNGENSIRWLIPSQSTFY